MANEDWIDAKLSARRAAGAERRLRTWTEVGGVLRRDGREILNFSSNDYLDLARHPRVIEAAREALERYGAGATASRLLAGNTALHEELEQRLAAFKGYPSALVFGSGWLTNVGVIPALAGPGDCVLADRLAHASLLDGALLSRARLARFRHNDAGHLEELLRRYSDRRCLIVTESVFSMDGDLAPLRELTELAERYGATLMVDEAHATGIFGPSGSGRIAELGLTGRVQISMGTMSKALGSYGGFVACDEKMRHFLIQFARSLIYSTALPPAAVGAALGALDVLASEPERGGALLARAEAFRSRLRAAGLNTLQSASPIVPVLVGSNEAALRLSQRLWDHGVLAPAIRPPTVPEGTARLRFSITLAHTPAHLEQAAEIVIAAAREEGII